MRRVLSILLVLLFGLGPLTATLSASEDAGLPPCCRRHGAHHCAMAMRMAARMAASKTPAFSAPDTCPLYPRTLAPLVRVAYALAAEAAALPSLHTQTRATAGKAPAFLRAPSRAHAGRGPPASDRI